MVVSVSCQLSALRVGVHPHDLEHPATRSQIHDVPRQALRRGARSNRRLSYMHSLPCGGIVCVACWPDSVIAHARAIEARGLPDAVLRTRRACLPLRTPSARASRRPDHSLPSIGNNADAMVR